MLEDDPKTGKKQMQAESPDEEALVDGAKVLRCVVFRCVFVFQFFLFALSFCLAPLFPVPFFLCRLSHVSVSVLSFSFSLVSSCVPLFLSPFLCLLFSLSLSIYPFLFLSPFSLFPSPPPFPSLSLPPFSFPFSLLPLVPLVLGGRRVSWLVRR